MQKIQITFIVNDEAAPDPMARALLAACFAHYALRPGEGIQIPSKPKMFWVIPEKGDLLTAKKIPKT